MLRRDAQWPNFSERDLDFVVENVAPGSADPSYLKRLISEDPQFRAAMVGDESLLQRVQSDDEIFLYISPALYFEILLRNSHRELETAAIRRSGKAECRFQFLTLPTYWSLWRVRG